MSEQHQQWIGLDVCKDYLDIAIHPEGKTFRLANDDSGQAELVHRLSSLSVEGIVLEATGGIERAVMSVLETAGYQTRRVNPLQIRHFAKAAGKLAKTDKIDAEIIAHFGQSLKPPVTLLPDAQTRELQALVTRRQQVVAMVTMGAIRCSTNHGESP
jgi:transposase